MDLELKWDEARVFPEIDDPAAITTARIWHCKYRTLSPLSALTNVRTLKIATYPDESLEYLSPLTSLEILEIDHLPKISDLGPLSSLTNLRRLHLATLPSWDSSGKVTTVTSLAPLAQLPRLEELELFGVVPPDRSVDDLLKIPTLRRARVSKYPKREQGRLAHLQDEHLDQHTSE